ncbi:asparagine synthase (glutamine-hydrolyzing) [Clostridiales bacterium COT073_COT-073]|nr:asparagine synthase (glutamine-hydrolyzing) [Clostridiales bacterium COT073_COT-073]
MCGFVGFIDHIEAKEQIIKKMTDKIIHRGPDEDGYFINEEVALGFRRLSILDLELSHQPMYSEDGSKVMVFNGEIYNYQEIRAELIKKGKNFQTNGDTEVLLKGFEVYGKDILNKLRGMFAFAVYDLNKKQLFAARDFFGIKPFYYAPNMGGSFIFGSEIKSFLPHPNFVKELDEAVLENYLSFQYSATNRTFFQGVKKLPPAHYLIYDESGCSVYRYWEPKFAEKDMALEEAVAQIDKAITGSVETHKIADVEVGCFLSSGVDSSYVASVFSGNRKTFTVGFDYDKYNETEYAKALSREIGVDCYDKIITTEEYWNILPKLQYHLDEPLADPAAIALYFVSNLAKDHVKVVMSGEGADEIFGGYRIYHEPLSLAGYEKIPLFLRKTAAVVAEKLPNMKGKSFLQRGAKTLEERFIGNANIFSVKERKEILKHKTLAKTPQEITKPFYDKVKNQPDITKMQYLDLHLWMVGDILLKADKMSMANSLELRVPFLDKEVMALAGTLPVPYRVNRENTKYAMRLAAKKHLPEAVANKRKLGFPVPIRVWLREEKFYHIVREAFQSEIAERYFQTEKLVRLLDQHRLNEIDNSRKIWTVYMFLLWYEKFFTETHSLESAIQAEFLNELTEDKTKSK